MRSNLLILFFTFTSLTLQAQQSVETEVQQCFDNYKAAILEGRGEDAARLISQSTEDYYTKMRKVTLNADSAEVSGMGLIDKLLVLIARLKVSRSEMEAMDGIGFFVYAVDEGMVGKESVINLELGNVEVTGNSATGQITVNGQATPLSFTFYREGPWKLDLTSIFDGTSAALNQMVQQSGMAENAFIMLTLQGLTGTYPDPDIWHPDR